VKKCARPEKSAARRFDSKFGPDVERRASYATNEMFFVWTFSVPTRVPITGISVSNVANFSVTNASSTTTAATAIHYITGNNYTASIDVTPTGTPLVAGNASGIESVSASAQIIFTEAEI
jgi:hypothetical protein